MHQNRASLGNGLVDESTRGREVNEKIYVVDIFDRDPQLLDPASRNVSWDGVRADRHDMGDPPLRYSSRGPRCGHAKVGDERNPISIQKDTIRRGVRYELAQQELIFDDRVDVLPAHRLVCVVKGYTREKCTAGEEWRMPGKNASESGVDWRNPMVIAPSTFVVEYRVSNKRSPPRDISW